MVRTVAGLVARRSLPFSPALLILPFPGMFRFTCYYYRGAYYKAFWADPPSCAVGEPRKGYCGENSFPLILQNIHRYFLYIAVLFIFLLAYDVWKAMWFPDPATGQRAFGIGVGTLVLAVNVVLLGELHVRLPFAAATSSADCEDDVSKSPALSACYDCVSASTAPHALGLVQPVLRSAFSDIYVRLCSMGVCTDWRIF